jgi:hypothetical protein
MPVSRAVASGGPVVLLLAALVPEQRLLAAVAIMLGWVVLRLARRLEAIAWAAVLPVAVALVWPFLAGNDVPVGEVACVDPLSAITVRRVGLAGVVLVLVALLAVAHGSDLAELGLVRPPWASRPGSCAHGRGRSRSRSASTWAPTSRSTSAWPAGRRARLDGAAPEYYRHQ